MNRLAVSWIVLIALLVIVGVVGVAANWSTGEATWPLIPLVFAAGVLLDAGSSSVFAGLALATLVGVGNHHSKAHQASTRFELMAYVLLVAAAAGGALARAEWRRRRDRHRGSLKP